MRKPNPIPHRILKRALFALLLSAPVVSAACPDCPVGRTARQQVLEQGFSTNLAIALAPFLFIAAVSLAAERIGKPRLPPQKPQT